MPVSDNFVSFDPSAQADDALFRAAGLRAWADVDGREWDILSLDITNQVNTLPRASIEIALGNPASDEYASKVEGVSQAFKRFAPVKIWVEVAEVQSAGPDVRGALPAGKYMVYEGVVETPASSRSSSGVGMTVYCQHKFAQLGAGTSVFSPFLPTDLSDLSVIYTGTFVTGSTSDLTVNKEFWGSVTKAVENLFKDTKVTLKERARGLGNFPIDRLQSNNDAAVALMGEVKSLLTFAFSTDKVRNAAGETINNTLRAITNKPDLFALAVSLGDTFSYVFTATADGLYVIPRWPCHGGSIKTAPPGSFFVSQVSEGVSGVFALTVGTVVISGQTSTYVGVEGGATVYAGYLAEGADFDPNFAVVQASRLPVWMPPTVASMKANESKGTPRDEVVPRATHSPQGVSKEDKGPGIEAAKENKEVVDRATLYARYLTLDDLYSPSSLSIVTGLRFDVVPGQNLRVEMRAADSDEIIANVGWVQKTQLVINAEQGVAQTHIAMSHIRSEADQADVVEAGQNEHYAWENRVSELNEIVWAEGG